MKVWMRVRAAAEYADVHPDTLYKALRRGECRGEQPHVNASWKTKAEWVDAWLAGGCRKKQRRGLRAA